MCTIRQTEKVINDLAAQSDLTKLKCLLTYIEYRLLLGQQYARIKLTQRRFSRVRKLISKAHD